MYDNMPYSFPLLTGEDTMKQNINDHFRHLGKMVERELEWQR